MGRSSLIPVTKAARLKRVARKTLWAHAKAGSFDVLRVGNRIVAVIDNARWRAWEPNRKRQRTILRGLRKRGR